MLGPLGCLLAGIALIIFLMLYLRFHAFLALILSAIVIALLSDRIPAVRALPLVGERFVAMLASIGMLLVMAAIIGKCLMDSGAAERIVRAFTRVFGPGRENYSLLSSGFVLSIPVFFDTVFYLLAPLARAVYARWQRNYVLIVCAAAAGGALTHALVPPTPGPILVAEQLDKVTQTLDIPLRVTILMTMWVGILVAAVPAVVGGVFYARWIDRRLNVVPKDALGVSQTDLEEISKKPDRELPGFLISLLPFILPVVLLAGASILDSYSLENAAMSTPGMVSLRRFLDILGDRNLAFFLGALIGIGLLASQKKIGFRDTIVRLKPAISSGVVVACITCAGGAFGKVLYEAQVGEFIAAMAQQWNLSILMLAFLSASLIRIAQGSATVAMITAVGIIAPTLHNIHLAYHPVYLVYAIGFGATGYSWMNDSGFWIFSQLTGLTETQTLKSWTAMLTLMAVFGIAWVWVLTHLMPLV